MSQPPQADPGRQTPRPTADPTRKVARPPVPGRAVRAEVTEGRRTTPPIRPEEPTVTLTPHVPMDRRRTLQFGAPAPVKVVVGPRQKPRRRHRTWPWILAVILALVVLGIVLLVMLLQGATIDGATDLIGSARTPAAGSAVWLPAA